MNLVWCCLALFSGHNIHTNDEKIRKKIESGKSAAAPSSLLSHIDIYSITIIREIITYIFMCWVLCNWICFFQYYLLLFNALRCVSCSTCLWQCWNAFARWRTKAAKCRNFVGDIMWTFPTLHHTLNDRMTVGHNSGRPKNWKPIEYFECISICF